MATPKTAAGNKVPALLIKSRSPNGFRRAGQGFNPSGEYYHPEYFSEDQSKALLAETEVVIEQVDVEPALIKYRAKAEEKAAD